MIQDNLATITVPAQSPAISIYSDISFSCSDVDLYYGSFQALKKVDLRIEKKQNNSTDRPFRLWQIHFLKGA